MAVDFNRYALAEPNVAGVTATTAPAWFNAPADDAPMGYWRKPDGHIILSQYGENGTERKLDRGFTRLGARYGTYSSSAIGESKDPLYPLVAKGGLVEMPAEQIIQLGWHRRPDRNARRSHRLVESLIEQAMQQHGTDRESARLLVMPQLTGHDLTDYLCAACPGRWFTSEGAVLNHESVMHKDAVQSRSIGMAVAQAQGGSAPSIAADNTSVLLEMIASLQSQVAALQQQPKRGRPAKDDTSDNE